jgi:putative protein kinase ArgK-like GTPase of G3E family
MKPFSEFLNELVGKMGQGALADQMGIDGAALSRFRSGQGSISLDKVDKVLEVADAVIVSKADRRKLEDALATVSDLWSKERQKALCNGDGTRRSEK